MKPRISVLTLGVIDLEQSLIFIVMVLDFQLKALLDESLNMALSPSLIFKMDSSLQSLRKMISLGMQD
ncbi:hypothetical protein F895_03208 [Acinetobacter sp. CIP 64.2]|nr:hypothetical protein F895_03208 [Acinetobacter sp. CIP 64.2]